MLKGKGAAMTGTANSFPASADPAEVAKFTAMADSWWAIEGPFRPLHLFNPIRIAVLKRMFSAHFRREGETPFTGLSLLDVGCGGGLIAEPMTRMGFAVTGIDPAAKNIQVAQEHARRMRLAVDYRVAGPEQMADLGRKFDVILALEVVEHVPDPAAFLAAAAPLLAKDGMLALATLNRTPKSLLLAKFGAEYVLRWLPVGTHDWRKFVKPSELARAVSAAGLGRPQFTGLSYNPLSGTWRESPDLDMNYMAFAVNS